MTSELPGEEKGWNCFDEARERKMSEPGVEWIVRAIECRRDHRTGKPFAGPDEVMDLIASWRERGEALKECAEDLEAELRARYCFNGSVEPHPSMKHDFDRDMDIIYRIRRLIQPYG